MTGVKAPAGVLGASVVLANHAVKGTLPFTGAALTVYLAAGGGLVLAGIGLRVLGRTRQPER